MATEALNRPERPAVIVEPPPPPRTRGRGRALLMVFLVGAVLATAGFLYWRYAQTYESTDDAQVDGHLNGISARISGTVTSVMVEENQFVKAGQLLVEIDPSDYKVALDQTMAEMAQKQAEVLTQNPNVPIVETSSATSIATAQADVANAEAGVAWAERDYLASQARLRQAEAESTKARDDLARYKALVDKDEISRQIYDQAVSTANAAIAAVDSARAAAEASEKLVDQRRAQLVESQSHLAEADRNAPNQLAISRANVAAKQADANVARTRVAQARLNLSYTKIYAPVSGVVTKRSVEVGNHVQPGQQLLLLAQLDDLWVTANFKETQLHRMHPGQPVKISVDAYGMTLNGTVESMPGATGTINSLLPPENASGNYVKVVQRLPVRIRFDKNQQGLDRLRPGMSVVPKITL
ncbi:MAG: HlyD family secretion protein [Acidobacteriia bacterium]|nr:HlyD family secretion protein [Terriglobia bacterium]